jgi:hypothetical protein
MTNVLLYQVCNMAPFPFPQEMTLSASLALSVPAPDVGGPINLDQDESAGGARQHVSTLLSIDQVNSR